MTSVVEVADQTLPATGPYKFLDYYLEKDRLSFAGREDDVAEVLARVGAERTFVLYGRSGLGKTSLLRAGVFPVLRERGFRPIIIRILESPLQDLRDAVADDLQRPDAGGHEDLAALVEQAASDPANPAGVVLVFDQFEEFFIRQRQQLQERRAFIQKLAWLLDTLGNRVRATFSLREDYLAEMDDFRFAFPEILASQYRLRPLTAFGARQAIVTPLVQAGIAYDQRLVVRLVDLLAESDFDPVLLQIACSEVYREAVRRGDQSHVTEADLDRIGGLDGLFRRYLDNAINTVPPGQVLLCRAILDTLITIEQTKRAVTAETLQSNEDYRAALEEIASVLERLEKERLIRRELRGSKLWYELTHERLVLSILEWFKLDADFTNFREARGIIAQAAQRDRFRVQLETLLAPGQIKELIHPYRERLRLTPAQREFMFWSAVYRRIEDVDYWARAFGYDRCAEVLSALLGHDSGDARVSALVAAGLLGGHVKTLAPACLRTALEDKDREVRRAAGRSLAALAGPEETRALAAALRSRATRRQAIDVLGDFAEAGGPLSSFARYWRWRARRRLKRRALGVHRDLIRSRSARGAVAGLLAAVLWTAFIAIAGIALDLWTSGEPAWPAQLLPNSMLVAIAAAILGPLLGWRLARSAAKRAAISGEEGGWFSAGARVVGVFALVGLLTILGALYDDGPFAWGMAAFVAGLLLASPVAAACVRLLRPVVYPDAGRRDIAIWGVLLALGPSLLGVIALGALETALHPPGLSLSSVSLVVGGVSVLFILVSFLWTVMAITFAETSLRQPIGRPPQPRPHAQRAWRTALVAAAVIVLPAFVAIYGRDSLPVMGKVVQLPASERIELPFGWPSTESVYVKLRPTSGQPEWHRLSHVPDGVRLRTASGPLGGSESEQMLFVPAGGGTLTARKPEQAGSLRATVGLEPVLTLDEGEIPPLVLSERTWTPVVLRLAQGADGASAARSHVWRGTLAGPFPGNAAIRIALPAGTQLGLWTRDITISQGGAHAAGSRTILHRALSSIHVVRFAGQTDPRAAPLYQPAAERELNPVSIAADGSFRLELELAVAEAEGPSIGPARERSPIAVPVVMALRVESNKQAALHNQLALSYLNEKKYDLAVVEAERAVRLDPGNATLTNGLAWALVAAGRAEEALPLARQIVLEDPTPSAEYLDTLAHAAYAVGNWADAANAWDHALAIDPNFYKSDVDPLCANDQQHHREARARAQAAERGRTITRPSAPAVRRPSHP